MSLYRRVLTAAAAVLTVAGAPCSTMPRALAQSGPVPPSGSTGYYRPVAPQPQSGPPCGHYGTPPCAVPAQPRAQVTIPSGASADQLFQQGSTAFGSGKFTVAAAYYERAAEMGHVRAQAALGLMYVNGKGEEKNQDKAVYWLTKAADGGHRVAEAQLGEFYEHGIGVPVDVAKAIRYYQQSAAQHWWLAEYSLGVDYELGVGVERSRATAIELLNRAAADGQDGLSQDVSAMLQRPDTPRFADAEQMGAYLNTLRGRPDSIPTNSNPLFPSAQQQYIMNRMRSPGNTCSGSYGVGCN